MDSYHIALFIHLVTLLVAAGATAITKLAAARCARARTVGELQEWHGLLVSAARLFPICLAFFVASGAYMLGVAHASVWTSPYVVAGLTGVVLLLASGAFLGAKARVVRDVLAELARQGTDRPAPKLVPPRLVVALPAVNTGIALAVVFDMVTKPGSTAAALTIIVAGIVLGGASALRKPAPRMEQARAA